MAAFFGSFATYVVKALILLGIGLCGGAVGIRLRKNKDKQN